MKQTQLPMPICLLVAPVATVRPTLPELVVCPMVPSSPPLIVPRPSANSPSPTDLMSSRFQLSSFTFWQVVRLPMVLMLEHRQRIKNGANKAGSKLNPTWLRLGKATQGVPRELGQLLDRYHIQGKGAGIAEQDAGNDRVFPQAPATQICNVRQ